MLYSKSMEIPGKPNKFWKKKYIFLVAEKECLLGEKLESDIMETPKCKQNLKEVFSAIANK